MKNFTKILIAILAIAMLFSLAACGKKAPASDTDIQQPETEEPIDTADTEDEVFTTVTEGVLTMATNAAFPPYEFYEGDAITGIDAEIAAAIAKKLGLELVIDDMEFEL